MNAGRTAGVLVIAMLAGCSTPVASESGMDVVLSDAVASMDARAVTPPVPVCRAGAEPMATPGAAVVRLSSTFVPASDVRDIVSATVDARGRVLACSGGTGLVVLTTAGDGGTLAQLGIVRSRLSRAELPRCQHAVVDGDTAYVSARMDGVQTVSFVSVVDLAAQPPVERAVFTHDGWNVTDVDVSDGHLVLALLAGGIAVMDTSAGEFTVRSQLASVGDARAVTVRDGIAWVALGPAGIAAVDVHDPASPRVLGHLAIGGSAVDIAVDPVTHRVSVAVGDAGIVVIDGTDPANPVVRSRIASPDPVLALDVRGDLLAAGAWSDARLYDLHDPVHPVAVAAVHPPSVLGVSRVTAAALGDRTLIVAEWGALHAYALDADARAPSLDVHAAEIIVPGTGDGDASALVTQTIALENVGRTTLHVTSVDAPPGVSASWNACDIEPGATASLDVRNVPASTPLGADAALVIHSDDPNEPARAIRVRTSAGNVRVGDVAPPIVLEPVDGTATTTVASLHGKVVVVAYFAAFCPSCALEFPDLETSVWQAYRTRGVVVLGLNPQTILPRDTPDLVAGFAAQNGVSFPLGWDMLQSYSEFNDQHGPRLSPFPLDVVIDQNGRVALIETEYSPATLRATIDRLLSAN